MCFSLCCCLLLATVMAESCYFWTCNRNSVCRLVFTLVYTHCRELINQWGSCDREVTIIHVTVDGHWTSDILTVVHPASEYFLFSHSCFVLSSQFCKSFRGSLSLM
jgi:hypothetical protein